MIENKGHSTEVDITETQIEQNQRKKKHIKKDVKDRKRLHRSTDTAT